MKNKKNIRTIIKATTTFLLLSVMFCVMNIYGAESAWLHGRGDIGAYESEGKLVFTTSGLKLDSDYTSENNEYFSNNSSATFEMYLITNKKYKNNWNSALTAGDVKLMAQRTFTKNGSNQYSYANDLSGTYTVTSTSTMSKILEHVSSPTISAGTLENAYSFSTASWSYAITLSVNSSFTFKYYYFYTKDGSYTLGNNTLATGYTVMYKINSSGSWKDSSVSYGCNIPTSELSAGDTVYIKLVDSLGMGYESNTITVKVHSLTVKPNEGTWSSSTSNQTYLMLEGQTMTIPVPTRDNYSFNKWSLSGTGSSMSSYTANGLATY